MAARDNGCLHAYMLRFVGRYPQLQSMGMVYENGELAASSLAYPVRPHNLSNTQYFRVARSRPQAPYYIAEQQIDPTGSSPIIPFVTGVLDKKALFSGVLIAGLNPEHYQKFYTSISQNRDLVMRLFRDDGISLSRYPYIAEEIGRDISHKEFFDRVSSGTESGVFYETSKIDNINRIYGWRRVEGWPLGVSVGVNRDAVLAPWWRETIIALGISLFLLLGGTLLIIYVLRQLTRLERTEADLYLTKVAVERGADMAIWLDPPGHIRYVNATTCNRFGFSEQDLLAMRFRDINPSFKPESWPKFWGRLRQHRHLFDEIVLRTRTGEEFPCEVNSTYIQFKGQEYNCAVVRDISERKMAEDAVVKSEQQLRLALEASSTGLFDMPLDGRRTAITSPEYDRLLGYLPGELVETFEKGVDKRLDPNNA
ncbi:MAG: PAS domain S-box protein, partial [Pseudomonadota bacterium]